MGPCHDRDAATHWSQANYVALVTGQFTACEQKDGASPATRTSTTCSISSIWPG
jgi:hypothetical protein